MSKHVKGAQVRNWQDLVDCLHAGQLLYIDTTILQHGQLKGWTFARLNEKMALGKIWRAVIPAPDNSAIINEAGIKAMQCANWIRAAISMVGTPTQTILDGIMLFVTINEDVPRYLAYVDRQWQRDKEESR